MNNELKEINEKLEAILELLSVKVEDEVSEETVSDSIIEYQDIESMLVEEFGEAHENSTFYDRGSTSIFCALPDNVNNDSLYDGYCTDSFNDDFFKKFLNDYVRGNRSDKYKVYDMDDVLAILCKQGLIKSGSYIVKVSW